MRLGTLLAVAVLGVAQAVTSIVNTDVYRAVDLMEAGSNLITFLTDVKFTNPNNEPYYYYTIAKDFQESFVALHAFIEHPQKKDEGDEFILQHEQLSALPSGFFTDKNVTGVENLMVFRIHLPQSLSVNDIKVLEYHKGRREPYPKKIKVFEKQKVEMFESKYYLSVYPTEQSSFGFQVKKQDVHYKSEQPTSEDNDKIQYGPYSNLPPISFHRIELFFTFPYPLPSFTEARRDIYVSHWGSVAIDEYFNLFNEAAGINGQFSRVDYMPYFNPNHGQNAINKMGSNLPQYIHGLYYYDYIGNISSSHAFRHDDHVSLDIEPRFPIFGQWKTDWNQGYNMPTEMHLYTEAKDKSKYILEVDFMHAYENSLAEDYTVRVILPEGATDIKMELPSVCGVKNEDITVEKFFGTLDYFGRPMIVIKKENAVHTLCNHNLIVKYSFNPTSIYIEVFCMFGLLFALYMAAIIYSKMELSLEKKEKLKSN